MIDGSQETFDVSINGVEYVTRNCHIAGVRDLAKNDSVVLSLTYGKVVSIKATSETENVSGTIKEIILSETPQITLDVKGKSETYNLTASTSVYGQRSGRELYTTCVREMPQRLLQMVQICPR